MKIQHIVLLTILLLTTTVFGETYTVQSGDTLTKIAQNQLNDSNRWKEIAELNNLKEPYTLSLGQQLELPETTSSNSTARSFPPTEQDKTPSDPKDNSIDLSELENLDWIESLPLLFAFYSLPTAITIILNVAQLLLGIFFLGVGYRFTAAAINLETTLRKCVIAAVSVTLSLFIPVGIILLVCCSSPLRWPPALLMISPILLLLGYIFLAMYIIRICLQCGWTPSFIVVFLGAFIGPALYAALFYTIIAVVLLFAAIISAIAMLF